MQTGNADIVNPFDTVAHDFRRYRRLLRHGQITGAGANDPDGSGTFGQGFFLDGHTAGKFVVSGKLEFFAQRAGLGASDTRDEHARFGRQNIRGYFDDLFRRFAAAENDFGETFAERTVRVHLRETEVGDGRGLKRAQNLVAAHSARAEFFQQLNRFSKRHNQIICVWGGGSREIIRQRVCTSSEEAHQGDKRHRITAPANLNPPNWEFSYGRKSDRNLRQWVGST